MDGCLACELTSGLRELPGGRIHETHSWVVEHCVGPLGVGSLILKPKRHITHVWELNEAEAQEHGPLLRDVSSALAQVLEPEQIYVNLWSHAGGRPVHIHWVLQSVAPVRDDDLYGPHLQVSMFDRGEAPPRAAVEKLSDELRLILSEPALRSTPGSRASAR